MGNLKRKQEMGVKLSPGKRQKVDVRQAFMLMPGTKTWDKRVEKNIEEVKLARTKTPTSPLDEHDDGQTTSRWPATPPKKSLHDLPNDVLLEIMRQLELTKYLQHRDTSTLWSLLGSSDHISALWRNHRRSILTGMQEAQFPEYLSIFGRVGRQSEEQLHNLKCAIATRCLRTFQYALDP